MGPATALIPDFKSVRGAFAAGGLWLVVLVISIQPRLEHASRPLRHIWHAITTLGRIWSPVAGLIGAAAAAYLLGVISDAAFGGVTRYATIRAVQVHRFLARIRPFTAGPYWGGKRKAATITDFLETALGPEFSDEKKFKQDKSVETAREVRRHVRASRVLAYSADDRITSDVDQLLSDCEYRLRLVAPLIGLGFAVAVYLPVGGFVLSAFCGLGGAVAVALSANHSAELGNDRLEEWQKMRNSTAAVGTASIDTV